MSQPRIYLSPPHQTGHELDAVRGVLDSNWLAPVGPDLNRFEEQLADRVGVAGVVAVSSGTAALHLALRHLELMPGDEVLCSTLTFCASANPIVYEGGKPVFIDAEPGSWNLDPELVRDELKACAARNRLPRAIVAVDVLGQCADFDAINEAAAEYGVPVIEDAAESLGADYRGRPAGSLGWASLLSFNGNKMISTSGGGALCSNDETLLAHARKLATQAKEPVAWYEHNEVGFNYRMSNLLAAIGCCQLGELDRYVERRRENCRHYAETIGQLPSVTMMPEAAYGRACRWLTAITIDAEEFGADCEQVRLRLEELNIESRRVWKPLHQQPVYAGCRSRGGAVADRLFATGLCLPSGSALTAEERQRVIDGVTSMSRVGRRAA